MSNRYDDLKSFILTHIMQGELYRLLYGILRELNVASIDKCKVVFSSPGITIEAFGLGRRMINPTVEKNCREGAELINQIVMTESPSEKLALLIKVLENINDFSEKQLMPNLLAWIVVKSGQHSFPAHVELTKKFYNETSYDVVDSAIGFINRILTTTG